MTEDRFTLAESSDRYRQTLVFNNDFLKREFPERYEFNTEMEVSKKQRYGVSDARIDRYKERRAEEFNKKYAAYCKRLDAMVEPAVKRYTANLKSAFGF